MAVQSAVATTVHNRRIPSVKWHKLNHDAPAKRTAAVYPKPPFCRLRGGLSRPFTPDIIVALAFYIYDARAHW
jgi:hypothetical protein